jgi:hypothetical protein
MDTMTIQPETLLLAGILMLALVTVESGGYFLTRVSRGLAPVNDLQRSFFRAGHAHAAVLLVLSLVLLVFIDAVPIGDPWRWAARSLVPIAAILMPAGFFLSVLGKDPQRPSRLIVLLWLGVASLTAGLVIVGISLVVGGVSALG